MNVSQTWFCVNIPSPKTTRAIAATIWTDPYSDGAVCMLPISRHSQFAQQSQQLWNNYTFASCLKYVNSSALAGARVVPGQEIANGTVSERNGLDST